MVFKHTVTVQAVCNALEGTAAATQADNSLVARLRSWLLELHDCEPQTSNVPLGKRSDNSATISAEYLLVLATNAFAQDEDARVFARYNIAITVWCELARTGNDYQPSELQKIWEIVFQTITATHVARFRFSAVRSAQGFLAVPLCSRLTDGCIDELLRLHLWLPDNQRGLEEIGIHAHQPYAQSWILAGFGENSMYQIEAAANASQASHAVYIPVWSDGNQAGRGYKTHQTSSTITNTGKFVCVLANGKQIHTKDMSYAIPAGICHGSMVPGGRLHATLFFFDSSRGFVEDAMVLGPKDGKEYTQIRDSGGITPACIAQLANAARCWEQECSITNVGTQEHPDIMGYYDYFIGSSSMAASQHANALT